MLVCAVFGWFYLCHRLFTQLSSKHPKAYEAIGKPILIMNNNVSNNILFMKFLYGRHWRNLNDPGIEKLAGFMFVYSIIYLFGLVLAVVVS